MKKLVVIFCLLAIVIQLIQIIYFQRSLFTTKYDIQYWKDRYEHSQYQLPLSKRIIGDDGLHAYAGYELIKGADPFSINNDKPPAGKYLLGLSILIFNNPLHIVFFFGLCTLLVFYFIARHFFKDSNLALFTANLLFLDPLFFSQFWIATLDLMQLFFLLANILLVVNIRKTGKWGVLVALMSGISLGIFMEVKPPVLLPIIFILETIFFLYKGLRKEYLIFIIGFSLGIFLPYLRFIYLGNGAVEILKVHKYVASIYLQSQLKVHIGAIWQTLLTGRFPNPITGSLLNISEWWIVLSVLTLSGIVMAFFSFFAKKIPIFNKGLAIFFLVSLIVFTFIPSYPRYLILVLPFLYLFGISFFRRLLNRSAILYLILLTFGIINSFFFLLPKTNALLVSFYYNLSHLYFHDIYQENIANSNSLYLTRDKFRYIANKAFKDANVKEIEMKELSSSTPMFGKNGIVKIRMIYKTQDLGAFYEDKTIKLVKKAGKWKVDWNWDIVFNGFLPYYKLENQIIPGKRGSIISNSGTYLAQDFDGYLLSVNPEKINLSKEQSMLKTFSSYGYKGDVNFQNTYLENALPGSDVPILTTSQYISQKEKDKLLSYPGLTMTPYISRVFMGIDAKNIDNTFYHECCTRIYSSYSYHGVKGLEKEFDDTLWGYSGGKILMKDEKGAIIKVVYAKDKKDGTDVVLQ